MSLGLLYLQGLANFAGNIQALGDCTLCDIGDIMELNNEELNFAMSRFILEICKKSGDNYPAKTLYEIVICLQLYMLMYGKVVKILDKKDFGVIHNTLDNRMKELSKMGCVKPCHQARVIVLDEEEMLWKAGILGQNALKQLIETLLYFFGLHFAL